MKKIIRIPSKHLIYILFFVFGFLTSFKASAQVTIPSVIINSCSGSITAPAAGGVQPYVYKWYTGEPGDWVLLPDQDYFVLYGQAPGTYRVLVTDANGDWVEGVYAISEPITLDVKEVLTGLVCPEDPNSGVIILRFENGIPPYTWTLTGSSSLFTARTGIVTPTGIPYYLSIDNIPLGDYTFDWTDDFGCSGTEEITVSAPPITELTINTTTDVVCFGDSNGGINISATGGWGPNYAINIVSDGQAPQPIENFTNIGDGTSYTINNLAAGTYQIYYYDKLANPPLSSIYGLDVSNYNCAKSETFTINTPLELISTSTDALLSCFGDTDGNITGTITGGTAPYSITLNGTTTTFTGIADGGSFNFLGLSAGTYTFTTTDAVGCIDTAQASITQPDELITDFVSKQEVSCNAGTDGNSVVSVTGGTAPYIFKVDGVLVTPTIASGDNYTIGNLSAGSYSITITDQNNCTATTVITETITEPTFLAVATSGETLTCFGDSDGNITGSISGGTAPYNITLMETGVQFTGIIEGGAFDFSGLSAGTYNFTITDAKDCTTTVQETINTPLELISTPAGELLSCFGDTDGNITGTITGGTAPYSIILDDTGTQLTGIADGGSFDFSGLSVGTYTFTTTDAAGCIDTAQASITQPDELITDFVSKQEVSCNAGTDGNIMVSVTGGTAPYIFKVDGTEVTPTLASGTNYTIGNLSTGTYNITITDQNNCTATTVITQTITEPAEIILSLVSFQNLSCFNLVNGSITVGVIGGTSSTTQGEPNYIFTLTGPSAVIARDNGDGTWTFGSLDVGTYTISVTDQNNCISNPAQITQELTQPLAINFTALEQDISCNGAEDGSIDFTIAGGTIPYTYLWTGPNSFSETTQDISALAPGAYSITVTDDNGCTVEENYTITEPTALVLGGVLSNYNGFGVSGNGLSDGSIDITVTGGTTPYTYSWTSLNGTIPVGQETQEDLTGLNAGTYTVLITDSNSCTITNTWEITEPQELLILEQIASHVDVLCFGENTGVIEVVVTQQSVGPYDYTITNILGVVVEQVTDQTTSYVFGGLLAGTYTVRVADANGISKLINNIIVAQPLSLLEISSEIISDFNGFGISCNGATDGSIDITVSGGAAGYAYAWTGPNGFSAITQDISALAPGAYSITVTDLNGCTFAENYTITEPDVLGVLGDLSDYNGFGVSGNGLSDGSIDITLTGGTALYTYSWTSLNGTIPVGQETQEDLTGLNAGTYTVLITDSNSCTITNTWEITEPQELLILEELASHVDVLCFGENTGVIEVVVTQQSVGPYDYTITNILGVVVEQVTDQITSYVFGGLLAGTYTVRVADANGISKLINNIIVAQPLSLLEISSEIISDFNGFGISCNGAADGSIDITISGGAAGYAYAWTGPNGFSAITQDISALAPGAYSITVTDLNGCTFAENYTITEPDVLGVLGDLSDYNGFGVSGNGLSDGSIDITLTGGTALYTYSWTSLNGTIPVGQETQEDLTGLNAGTYTVLITDSNSCTIANTWEITEPQELLILEQIASHVDVLCFGENTGVIEVVVTQQSVGPYDYTITNILGVVVEQVTDQTTSYVFGGLLAGTYTVRVADANGISKLINNIIVAQPLSLLEISSEIISDFNGFGISCNGAADGSIDITVSGGAAGYAYAWTGPNGFSAITQDISALAPGAYSITVTDLNGCTFAENYTITEPDVLGVLGDLSNYNGFGVSGNGLSDGSIDITLTGGTALYTYSWTSLNGTIPVGQETQEDLTGLNAGTYTVLITDSNSCTITNTWEITEPQELLILEELASHVDVLCFGENTGIIEVVVDQGSVAPYDYAITNSLGVVVEQVNAQTALNYVFDVLIADTYTVRVTDANGISKLINNIIIAQPLILLEISSEIISDFNGFGISCNGAADASIDITVSGGAAGYAYAWTGPNGFSAITQDISALAPGAYSITVTDLNGCTFAENYTITEPTALVLGGVLSNYNGFGVSGNGLSDGSIDITLTGGTALYTYSWTSLNGTIPVGQETQEDLTGLNAGTYTVLITDSNSCTITNTWEITEPQELLILEELASHVDVLCFGENTGVIEVVVTQQSVGPYDYTITNILGVVVEQVTDQTTSYAFGGLLAGIYTVRVTDANGISKSINNIIIAQPLILLEISSEIISDFNGFGISCNGAADASIDITVSGGAAGYAYAWTGPNGFSAITQDISALAPGAYSITVTDLNGCTFAENYTITEPTALVLGGVLSNYNGFGVTGNGLSDGSIDITLTGGTALYTYSWTSLNGTIPVGQETQEDLTGLNAGTYTLLITDANSCTITDSWTITEPQKLLILEELASHVDVLCFGENTGIIEVVIDQGSVAPYDYTITNSLGVVVEQVNAQAALNYVFDVLFADIYTVTVTDANGISKSINNIIIAQPLSLLEISSKIISDFNGFGISCNGAADASIDITISGGAAGYAYAWTGPNGFSAITQDISALAPGAYSIVVTDANGCSTSPETYTITEPDEIIIGTTLLQNVQCFENSDGKIEITITGGTGVFTYNWTKNNTPYATTKDLAELSPGEYVLIVQEDGNAQCYRTKTFTITQPDLLEIAFESKTDILCYGDSTGSAQISVTGGTIPYQYSWIEASGATYNTEDLVGVPAGDYQLTLIDALGCSDTFNVILNEPDNIVLNESKTDITCFGSNDGTISIAVTGGVSPYTYVWSDLGSGPLRRDLAPGIYEVTVTDLNNCQKNLQFEIIEAPLFKIDPITTHISCFGATDGSIDLNLVGGIAPLNITWGDGNSAGLIRNNLSAGSYSVFIEDAVGCSIAKNFSIIEPNEIVLDAVVVNAIDCTDPNSGSIDLQVVGGTAPFIFLWSNGSTTEDLQNIGANNYTVTVTDSRGCEEQKTVVVTRQTPLVLSLNTSIIADCINKTVIQRNELEVLGGVAPYDISWSNGVISGANGEIMETTQNGTVIVEVTDSLGCTEQLVFDINLFTLGDPSFNYDSFANSNFGILSIDDPITFNNTSTGDILTYLWSFGDGITSTDKDPVHTYVSEGIYEVTLTVQYPYGCSYVDTMTVNIGKGYDIVIPNAFTPNDDGLNDVIRPVYIGMIDVEMSIYSTWGALVYFEKGLELKGWDGVLKNNLGENGNYIIKVKATTFYGLVLSFNRPITLIK